MLAPNDARTNRTNTSRCDQKHPVILLSRSSRPRKERRSRAIDVDVSATIHPRTQTNAEAQPPPGPMAASAPSPLFGLSCPDLALNIGDGSMRGSDNAHIGRRHQPCSATGSRGHLTSTGQASSVDAIRSQMISQTTCPSEKEHQPKLPCVGIR